MTKLNRKVIWITGASSGIGEALTYELAKNGNQLILSSRRKEELERVKGNCPVQAQADIRVLPLDLGELSTLQLSAEAAIQLFGHVDVLINNGGISQRSLAKETTLDVDKRIMEVDYFGTIALTKHLIPHFIERKSGHYVVVTSITGKVGTPYRTGYSAAKHALHGFFDALRAELWKDCSSIYVTLVCPGWTKTNVSVNALVGDGSINNKMDLTTDKGILPDVLAKKMIRAIERRKNEVYIGGKKETLAVYMKRFFPDLLARIIRKATVR
ncbi:MAG: SDR family oxidoreductase [Cyclobacteriaceae bacterium]|nr:SDR family oxidoreductase [Cyclobacteriaceae bacterium]